MAEEIDSYGQERRRALWLSQSTHNIPSLRGAPDCSPQDRQEQHVVSPLGECPVSLPSPTNPSPSYDP